MIWKDIIPYQVITGNYDERFVFVKRTNIIPYQVITGNYDQVFDHKPIASIIPYQVITGNYDEKPIFIIIKRLYHTK